MGRGRRAKPARKMKPVFYVYSEGKTEEAYVLFVKQKCRIPIQIRSKIAGSKMSPHYLRQQLKPADVGKKDRIFLVYDLDDANVAATLENKKVKYCFNTEQHPFPTSLKTVQNASKRVGISGDFCGLPSTHKNNPTNWKY